MNNSKKTQPCLPGFRAAREPDEPASCKTGETKLYYICDRLSTTMLLNFPEGLAKVEFDLQNQIPHLFNYRAAVSELRNWPGMIKKLWPYTDPCDWVRIRESWS